MDLKLFILVDYASLNMGVDRINLKLIPLIPSLEIGLYYGIFSSFYSF